MSLPSSGSISMSQINSEAGLSSTQSNSSTEQRTWDYAVAGVNQDRGYAFSEFYGKTFSYGNSITLYYYYPWDGGNSPNNWAIWGWSTQAAALTHTGLYTSWSHTCYYNGTLGNGTDLYINPGVTGQKLHHLIDAGYDDTGSGTSAWYYLTDGTNNWTCQSVYPTITDVVPTHHTFQITSLTSGVINVYIDGCVSQTSDGSKNIYVNFYTAGGVAVSTTIAVSFYWNGDLGGNITGTVYIYSGNNCGSGTFGYSDYIGEYTSTWGATSISPSSYSSQVYNINTMNYYPCAFPC